MSQFDNPGRRIMAAAASRIRQSGVTRIDLSVADTAVRSKTAADIAIEYNFEAGQPSRGEIVAFIRREFGGQIDPMVDTILDHGNVKRGRGAITLVGTVDQLRKPITELTTNRGSYRAVGKMRMDDSGEPVVGTKIMHIKLAECWNVEEDDNGNRLLVREAHEDIGAILKARESAKQLKISPTIRLSALSERTASATVLAPGDIADYYCNGKRLTGTVQNASVSTAGRMYTIKDNESGRVDVVSALDIAQLVQRNAVDEGQERADLANFYTRVYGDRGFAQDLTASAKPVKTGGLTARLRTALGQ